jgi:hypothetical protein
MIRQTQYKSDGEGRVELYQIILKAAESKSGFQGKSGCRPRQRQLHCALTLDTDTVGCVDKLETNYLTRTQSCNGGHTCDACFTKQPCIEVDMVSCPACPTTQNLYDSTMLRSKVFGRLDMDPLQLDAKEWAVLVGQMVEHIDQTQKEEQDIGYQAVHFVTLQEAGMEYLTWLQNIKGGVDTINHGNNITTFNYLICHVTCCTSTPCTYTVYLYVVFNANTPNGADTFVDTLKHALSELIPYNRAFQPRVLRDAYLPGKYLVGKYKARYPFYWKLIHGFRPLCSTNRAPSVS